LLNQPVLFWDSWKISFKCVCRYCFWCVPGSNAKKIIRSQIITNFAHFPLRFTEQTTFWHFLSCKFDSSKLLVSTGIYQQQLLGLKSRNGGQYRLRYDHVNPLLSSWKHQKSCKCFFLWFSVVVLILAVDPSLSILYLKSISTFLFFFFFLGQHITGWNAKFLLRCGISSITFHFTHGCVTPSYVCCDHEHHGQ